MIALDWMTITAPIAIAGLNIVHPTSPELLSSLLDMRDGHWLYRGCGILASTIFQVYLWKCYAQMTLIIFGVIYLFICSMPVFLYVLISFHEPVKLPNRFIYMLITGSSYVLRKKC